jgi:hypothetical protein
MNKTHAKRKQLTQLILPHENQNCHSPFIVVFNSMQPDLLLQEGVSALSNDLIVKFRKQFTSANDTVNYYLTQTGYNNYVKLFDYRKLYEIGGTLIANYQAFADSSDYVELKDDHIRYGFLENEKPIELTKFLFTKLLILQIMVR